VKVTISGYNGFVGRNLVTYLKSNGIDICAIDLRRDWEKQASEPGAAIIHLAGKAHDLKKTSGEQSYFDVNTELTKVFFDRFLESDAHDFIFMSSVKAAADTVCGAELTEEMVSTPKTAYGRSKLAAEEYLLSAKLPPTKRVFILRPCMIHGPGNKGNLNLLYSVVKKGIPYPLGAFHNQRSFLSIDNLLYTIYALLTKPDVPSGIYQVSDDEPLATNDVVKIISNELHKKANIWNVPRAFMKSLAKIGDYTGMPFNSERLAKMTENYVVSNQKIKTTLGLQRMPVSAKEGLAKTIQSFNQQ